MCPRTFVQPRIGWRYRVHSNPQHAVKRDHWPEATVESKNILIEVCLQVLRRYAMVRPEQPSIEVPERNMDHREVFVGFYMVSTDSYSLMPIAPRCQGFVTDPCARPHFRSWRHIRLYERYQRLLLPVWNNLQPEPACENAASVTNTITSISSQVQQSRTALHAPKRSSALVSQKTTIKPEVDIHELSII